MQSLNKAGLVQAQKGKGGGYALTKDPDQIALSDIIDAVDPFTRITQCPLGIPGHKKLCPLHQKLDNAYADFKKIFETCTLSHFAQNKTILCK